MHIRSMRVGVVRRAYDGTLRNTRHAWNAKHYVLVELVADNGICGYGEMYCDGGGSPEAAVALLRHDLAPQVIGAPALRPAALSDLLRRRMALSARGTAANAAISAIDIAAWDLLAKAAGQPLCVLLGGAGSAVPAYASGGMYGEAVTPDIVAAQMADGQRLGLAGAKIKVGGASLEEDIERLARTREAIGAAAPLMADAMFAPTVPEAIRLARAAASLSLHFLEAPTSMDDSDGWAEVHAASGVPLAGPELSDSTELMRRLVETRAVQYLQFDVAIAGGITMGLRLAGFAAMHRRQISLHCAASAVAMAAGAHLGIAVGNCDGIEFHLLHDGLRERLWESGWTLANGSLAPPHLPGLGIRLADSELALFSA